MFIRNAFKMRQDALNSQLYIEMSLFLLYLQCKDYFVFTPYVTPYYVACIYVYIGQKHLYAGLPNNK